MNDTPGTEEEFAAVLAQANKYLGSRYYEYSDEVIEENLHRYEGKQKAELLFLRGIFYTMERKTLTAATNFKAAYDLDNSIRYLAFYIEALVKLELFTTARPLAEEVLKTSDMHDSYRKILESVVNGRYP